MNWQSGKANHPNFFVPLYPFNHRVYGGFTPMIFPYSAHRSCCVHGCPCFAAVNTSGDECVIGGNAWDLGGSNAKSLGTNLGWIV